jgi:hypothetical protein
LFVAFIFGEKIFVGKPLGKHLFCSLRNRQENIKLNSREEVKKDSVGSDNVKY